MKLWIPIAIVVACACGSAPAPTAPAPVASEPAAAPAPKPPAIDAGRLYREWVALVNAGDWDAVAARFADDATIRPASSGMELRGPANIVSFLSSFGRGFPDLRTWPVLVVADGRRVAAVALSRGTHSEDMGPMKATGKVTSFVGLTLVEFDDAGLVRTMVIYADNLNFMGQLGQWQGDTRPVDDREPPTTEVISGPASDANRELVERWAARFTAHDAPGMLALYAPAAVLDDTHLAGPIVTGKAIAAWYSSFFPGFPDVAIEDLETWTAGEYAIATYAVRGTNGGEYPRLGARRTMRQIDLEVAAVIRVRNGVIEEHLVFVDGMAIGIQLGVLAF